MCSLFLFTAQFRVYGCPVGTLDAVHLVRTHTYGTALYGARLALPAAAAMRQRTMKSQSTVEVRRLHEPVAGWFCTLLQGRYFWRGDNCGTCVGRRGTRRAASRGTDDHTTHTHSRSGPSSYLRLVYGTICIPMYGHGTRARTHSN